MAKLVIFTGDLNFSVIRGVYEILDIISEVDKIIIVEQKQKHFLLEKIKRQKFNLKKNGWRWILHIILSVLKLFQIKTNVINIRRSGQRYTYSDLTAHPLVEYFRFDSIHSKACLSLLKRENVDLGISLAAPILKNCLFSLPRLGTINLHKGKLPDYKGMPAGYWEIHNGESEVGVTVHKIVEGLDAGDILLEDNTPIYKFSSADGIRVRLDEIGIQLVAKAVANILGEKEIFVPQIGKGHLYRKPTLKELSREKRILLKREGYSFIKEFVKKNIFCLYVLCILILLQNPKILE